MYLPAEDQFSLAIKTGNSLALSKGNKTPTRASSSEALKVAQVQGGVSLLSYQY